MHTEDQRFQDSLAHYCENTFETKKDLSIQRPGRLMNVQVYEVMEAGVLRCAVVIVEEC